MNKIKLPIVFLLIAVFSLAAAGQRSPEIAEDFESFDLGGEVVKLSDLKGKVVLVTFWSTRCAICHAEIPKLNVIADANAGKNIEFLGITMNNESLVKDYLKDSPFKFRILPNAFGVLMKYADKDSDGRIAMGFPAYFLIGKDGELKHRSSGYGKTEFLSGEIEKLLRAGR